MMNLIKKFLSLIPYFVVIILITRFVSCEQKLEALPERQVSCVPAADSAATAVRDENSLPLCDTLTAINQEYVTTVKPIFEQKCLMCHGAPKDLPLYGVIPPGSFLVKHDMEEAQHEADMRYDFPWRSNGTLKKTWHDLHELEEQVEEGEMPPVIYKVMHWQSGLTAEENAVILDWVKKSQSLLK